MNTISRVSLLALAAPLAFLGQAGCLGDRCGEDQLRRGNTCAAVVDARIEPEAGADAAPADSALGRACNNSGSNSDCPAEASFCVILPGKDVGYCTLKDCTLDPNDCPAGYTCLDLDKFAPGQPHVCIRL